MLPINKIKDYTYTQDIFSENDLKDQAIIKSIVSLVKELTIEVVFVGVETLEQSSYFLKNNLLLAQMHYFSKPITWIEIKKQLLPLLLVCTQEFLDS
ncbi:hypothetical protein ACTHO0_15315 [Cytobacillus praedii]|uniref:hypothetical protein n=1 Tax=Cytobacillus praedii TaxID=1742358 RepID=UPI003F7E5F11